MVRKKRQGITTENIFEKPTYKSILNLLIEFQDKEFQGKTGLTRLHFRYVLEQNYQKPKSIFCPICKKKYPNVKSKYCPECHTELDIDPRVKSNIKRLKIFFGDKLDFLIKDGRVIPDCITTNQNLTKFLNNLKNPPMVALEKIGDNLDVRYYIKEEFYNEAKRRENILALNFFPRNNIKSFPVNPNEPTTQRILYGLSDEIYGLFDDDDKKRVKANLDEIEKNIQEIFVLKAKAFNEETEKRIQEFLDNTKSETIKSLLREDGDSLVDMFHMSMVCLKNTPGDISNSKNNFFNHFGILTENIERYFSSDYQRKEISDFMQDYFFEGGKYTNISQEFRIKKFCSIWSLCFFEKDYGFSLSDIRELIQWGWENRGFIEMFAPMSIAFSRYDEYATNPLTKNPLD